MREWNPQANDLFLRAIELTSTDERRDFLDSACGGDDELRAQVSALLGAHEKAGSFLESPAQAAAVTPNGKPLTEGPGTIIGPYKLLEQIGEGGMGVVYMAEQTKPVRRKVALKIIKPGMDTKQVIARFEAERQALALMDHPNIATVLDAGTTESGRPYFVMELVRGVTITDYCDRERLSIAERLELFILVCRSVQHAHQKGIIHRDLKPSNVLITLHDGVPVPKIIDFGIAKATGQQLTEKTLFTALAQLIGTPLYMSPEQAELSGLDVDTRSDIYSLGVLLYELLTGTTPFGRDTFRTAAYDEIRRIIREEEPPKPSTRILLPLQRGGREGLPHSTLEATATTVSANRKSDPRSLGKSMRGELDWIVMKALEKDRNRRYETASGLAADLLRHLTDRPVHACPPSVWYRFTKAARRNRVAVVTAVLVVASLLVGTAVSAWQAIRAVKAERKTAAALKVAREQRELAGTVVNDMYTEFSKKILAHQPKMTQVLKEFLEKALHYYQGVARVNSADPITAENEAMAFVRVANIQLLLGALQQAEDSIRQGLARYEAQAPWLSSNPPWQFEKAKALGCLGRVMQATGRIREAEVAYRQSLAILETLAADNHSEPDYREELVNRALELRTVLREQDGFKPTEQLVERYLPVIEKLVSEHPDQTRYQVLWGRMLFERAVVLARIGQPEEQEKTYLHVLEIGERLLDRSPADDEGQQLLAHVRRDLGGLMHQRGRYQEAEAHFRLALELHERLAANYPDYPALKTMVTDTLESLSDALSSMGRPKEAEAAYRRSVLILERLVAESPTRDYRHRLLSSLYRLADHLPTWGRCPEAEEPQRRALKLAEELVADYPKEPDYLAEAGGLCGNLGNSCADKGRLEEAERLYRRGIDLAERAMIAEPEATSGSVVLSVNLGNLGDLLQRNSRFQEAERAYRRAFDVYEAVLRVDPTESFAREAVAELRMDFALMLHRARRRSEVEPAFCQAKLLFETLITERPSLAEPRFKLAEWLADFPEIPLRNIARATTLAEEAARLEPQRPDPWASLGFARYRAADWKRTINAMDRALEVGPGGDSKALFFLAMSHRQLGDQNQARECYDRAVEWMDKNRPKNDELRRFRAEAAALLGLADLPADAFARP